MNSSISAYYEEKKFLRDIMLVKKNLFSAFFHQVYAIIDLG